MSCSSCSKPFSLLNWKKTCIKEKGGCGKHFCKGCLSFAVAPESEESKGLKAQVSTYCKECFKSISILDFNNTVDIIGGEPGTCPSVIFVHGGGGCRNMFNLHAKKLNETKGYRCVLIDLPGHGSRMDEPLTLDTAVQVVIDSINTYTAPFNGIKPVYIGGSFGGYLGMELVGRAPDLLSGAIICQAGQNVGVGRGFAAGVGIFAMNLMIPNLSEATLLSGLVSEAVKNGHVPAEWIAPMTLRTGMFFHQGREQIATLSQSNPLSTLPKFQGKILFINGTKDHRDSEQKWKAACVQEAKLIDYEGGDHFFTHDDRFFDIFVKDCENFIESIFNPAPVPTASESIPEQSAEETPTTLEAAVANTDQSESQASTSVVPAEKEESKIETVESAPSSASESQQNPETRETTSQLEPEPASDPKPEGECVEATEESTSHSETEGVSTSLPIEESTQVPGEAQPVIETTQEDQEK